MYDKLNITENTLRILSLFTQGFDKDYYIREIERTINISPRTAQLILQDLEEKGILKSTTKGKTKLFSINKNETTKRYFTLTQQYKTITFLEKKPLLKEIIEQITPHIKGIAIIFGSYVKQQETKNSDLDIFVAGEYDKEAIKKISQTLNIHISIKCYPITTFKKKLSQDFLLKEILKNHVVFLNAEQFIQEVFHNR